MFLIYCIALLVAFLLLQLPETRKDLTTFISTGAILATFGSAIGSLGSMWERDLVERVRLNIDILFKDIIRQKNPWRRWPFLSRAMKLPLVDGTEMRAELQNPSISLDVGSHVIQADVPTVQDDFFDLPLFRNFWQLARFRKAAHTSSNRRQENVKNPATGMTRGNEYMAYECLFDTWKSIVGFRLARYAVHLGAGLTVFSASITALTALVWKL